MPRASAKPPILLPMEQALEFGNGPEGAYRSFVANGCIAIVRRTGTAPKGCLLHVGGDPSTSDG